MEATSALADLQYRIQRGLRTNCISYFHLTVIHQPSLGLGRIIVFHMIFRTTK